MTDNLLWDADICFEVIVIEVEGRLAKAPRKIFDRSPVFQDMFSLPQSPNAEVDGSSHLRPLKLEDVKLAAFKDFVRAALATEATDVPLPEFTGAQWGSVWSLARRWDMPQMMAKLEHKIEASFRDEFAASQLYLAIKLKKDHWIRPALELLAHRIHPLKPQEMSLLGLELAADVAILRESHKADGKNKLWSKIQIFHDEFFHDPEELFDAVDSLVTLGISAVDTTKIEGGTLGHLNILEQVCKDGEYELL